MRKTREIIRLRHQTELSERQIASACNVSPTTVGNVVKAAQRKGVGWPLPEGLSDSQLQAQLFPKGEQEKNTAQRALPDMEWIGRELKKKHVTLYRLWEEYHQQHPDGYSYSRLCELYRAWKNTQDPVMRQQHQAGEKMFVDWAGEPLRYTDTQGRRHEAYMFVAVLGASDYTYAAIFPDMKQGNWLRGHICAFEYFGGVPQAVVPDNTRTAVNHPCRYDPELNPAYQHMAVHYDTAVVPARVRKPRDKAKAENAVLNVGRRIIAALRDAQLHSFGEAAEAVGKKLEELNERAFSKTQGCRRSLFEQVEKPVLKPLPACAFSVGEWRKATVYKDYHIQLGKRYYSVPYTYIGRQVEVRISERVIEIYHDGVRIAVHQLRSDSGPACTLDEHRPPQHQAMIQRSSEKFLQRADGVGESCAEVISALLHRFPHPEMAFRSCEGVLRLAGRYGAARLENACTRALEIGDPRYRHIANMLENRRETDNTQLDESKPVWHSNVRGGSYYQGSEQ